MHGELEANVASARRLGRLTQAMRAALDLVAGVALPQLCAACREPVEGSGLCANCWSKLSFIAPPYCERLGIPFTFDAGPGLLSMEAIADPPAYGRARAAVRYDDVASTLVHALQYGDRLDLAPMMGRWMAAGNGPDASISPPCSPKRSLAAAAAKWHIVRSSESRRRRSRWGLIK